VKVWIEFEIPETQGSPPSPYLRATEVLRQAIGLVYRLDVKRSSVVQIKLENRGERVGKVTVER
jgi:hypothetical protein